METDFELLDAWRGGDKRAGNHLFQRHFSAIERFFRNKVDRDVEDLVQRTFMACVQGRDRFRAESSFRTFLFAVAHNVLRDQLRKWRRAGETLDVDELPVVSLGITPTGLLGARAEEKLLVQALRRIPSASQVILELYYWERLTGAELGQVLGVPEDTARSRLRKAKQQLEAAFLQLEASPDLLKSTSASIEQWAEGIRAQFSGSRP